MEIIKIIAYVCFGLAGLFVILAIAGEELVLIAASILSDIDSSIRLLYIL